MIVVSFFTRNGSYPQLAHRLSHSCTKLGLHHRIIEVADRGQWKSLVNLKADVIQQVIFEFRRPVLWVDVDCEILKLPTLLWEEEHDFGVYNWHADSDNANRFPFDPARMRCSSGVLWFRYTAPAIELLTRWRTAIAANPQGIDDQILDEVYNSTRPPVRPLWLPRTYNFMTRLYGEATPEVVIRHDYIEGGHRDEKVPSQA